MSVTSLLSGISFPNQEEYFGYNNDYTGFVPIDGTNPNDGSLGQPRVRILPDFSPHLKSQRI